MDTVNYWKGILLQWIKECNFLEKPFCNIEQTEIEAFFIKFREEIKTDIHKSKDLSSFLKEYYPLFEPHYDDENALSSSDYVYVYSLLLHFSCVMYADESFQKKCQQLNELSQQNIIIFFKKLLEASSFTKETLRHAMASIPLSPQPNISLMCMESPMKTPLRTDISPSTPRSCMLQERNKELHYIKSQLECELYEKGILDIELKKNQEKILKLSRELKASHQEIKDLKNDLLMRNSESDAEFRHSEEEQLNRRLLKQISQKEVEIDKQREDIDTLTEQKDILNEKLNHAEKQMKMFQKKIEELALTVDELTGELEQKNGTIQCLSEANLDLENHISELRSSSANFRTDLNVSVDCMDLSRTTNSSGSINSPENLGCSVVDIQLREKENENLQLREKITMIHLDNAKLSKHINDLTVGYSKMFDICNVNLIADKESDNHIEHFMVFSNYVENFVRKYEEQSIAFNKMKENTNALDEQNQALSSKVTEVKSELDHLKKEINNLQGNNKTLEESKKNLENAVRDSEIKLEKSLREQLEIEKKFENLQNELESLKLVKTNSDKTFKQRIEVLTLNLKTNQEQFAKLKTDVESKEKTLKHLETNLKTQYESDIHLLEDKLNKSSAKLFENEKRFQQFLSEKQDYENEIHNLKTKYDCMKKKYLEKLNIIKTELLEKDSEFHKLEKKISSLITELDEAKHNHDYVTNENNHLLREIEEKKDKISSLTKALGDNSQALQKLTDDQYQNSLIITKLQANNEVLTKVTSKCNEQYANAMEKLVRTEAELKSRQIDLDNISLKCNVAERDLTERTEYFSNIVDELKTQLQEIMEKDFKTTTTASDFLEKDFTFSVSSGSNDAVDTLKQYANTVILKLRQITMLNAKNEEHVANLLESERKLVQQKNQLERKLVLSERRILELRNDLEDEVRCEQNKLTNEVKRLNDDISNLEKVCDRLTEENSSLQLKLSEFEKLIEKLTQENKRLKVNNSDLQTDRANQLLMAEKLTNTETELRSQVVNMQSCVKNLEMDIEAVQILLLAKTRDAEILTKERDEANSAIDSMKVQISELQSNVLALESKSIEISKKYELANKMIEEKTDEEYRNIENLKVQLEGTVLENRQIKKELQDTNAYLNELKNEKITLELQFEKAKQDLEIISAELTTLKCEEKRLVKELAFVKETKFSMDSEFEKCNEEMNELKANMTRLICELGSIRQEKLIVEEEKNVLIKRLEEKLNMHMSSNENLKLIAEKLQLAERDLFTKQNLLKSEELVKKDLENEILKLQIENTKLKSTNENNIKRIEKLSLKLGETQAKSLRHKKDAEIAQNELEFLKSSAEMTQREISKYNLECKSLKEKLSKCEKEYDQLESKFNILEKANEILRVEKENVETSENELKITQAILEKNKAILEDKVRKLNKSLGDSNLALSRLEQEKVQLNLEIGGLNTELQERKLLLSMKLKEIQDVRTNFSEVKKANVKLMELNEKLQVDAEDIREENSRLNDQLSKLSLRLKITQEGHENMQTEMKALQAELDANKYEKDAIKEDCTEKMERLKEMEGLIEERHSVENEFIVKIQTLDTQLSKMSSEFRDLEQVQAQEKLTNEKLSTDISILQAKLQKSRLICDENEAKWKEEKEQLLNEVKVRDERIKETRLELEGKLDKMKNKMKTLYNDEITKMKNKQEREAAVMKSELNALKMQNKKYEENIKKLSSQIFRLNENILEYQKQNTFLKTKMKDLETKSHQINRITTTHAPQSSAHQTLSSNLYMEDEEGEIFNNTYLSDLKNGRMSELFCRDVSVQELQYRNSLVPPHLKSTYLAQFDHQMGEDEIRETPSLDDSSSTLLNTGQRKKVSGATSYKRPGPPTPSKNAGRLSFGGNGELNREILRETQDARNGPSSSKTPAKFKLFSSRLNIKDERTSYMTKFRRKQHHFGSIQCSSTPRKSKANFDHRRLLDQIMSTTSPGASTEDLVNSFISPAMTLPPTLKISELSRRMSQKWRQPKLANAATDSGASDINSSISQDVNSESKCKRSKRLKDRMGSIYFRGSMFARNCRTPNSGIREVFKKKSKLQRNANFNKYRNEMLNKFLVKKTSIWPTCAPCHNNNNDAIEKYKASSDDINNDKSSKHFQQLLAKRESHAPFEISEISCPSYLNGNSSSTVHSRTIYGASVILNRKIPNVNTTLVRKSSIYVKANDGHGVILVTNQTITLMDLAQMWIQMNISAKLVIGLSLTTLCVAIFSFVIQLLLW